MRPKRGHQGRKPKLPPLRFPLATIATYGPDDQTVTKLAVSVLRGPDDEILALESWLGRDVMSEPHVQAQIIEFLARHGVRTVTITPVVLGCPHEEGKDFPEGEDCPHCPFWAGKQGSGGDDSLRWAPLDHLEILSFDPRHPPRKLW